MTEEPPEWLVKTLSEHQPADDAGDMCVCSYVDRDALFRPKRFVECSPEHQAREVHKVMASAVAKLFNQKEIDRAGTR